MPPKFEFSKHVMHFVSFFAILTLNLVQTLTVNDCYSPVTQMSAIAPFFDSQSNIAISILPPSPVSSYVVVFADGSKGSVQKIVIQFVDSAMQNRYIGLRFEQQPEPRVLEFVQSKSQLRIIKALEVGVYTFSVACNEYQEKFRQKLNDFVDGSWSKVKAVLNQRKVASQQSSSVVSSITQIIGNIASTASNQTVSAVTGINNLLFGSNNSSQAKQSVPEAQPTNLIPLDSYLSIRQNDFATKNSDYAPIDSSSTVSSSGAGLLTMPNAEADKGSAKKNEKTIISVDQTQLSQLNLLTIPTDNTRSSNVQKTNTVVSTQTLLDSRPIVEQKVSVNAPAETINLKSNGINSSIVSPSMNITTLTSKTVTLNNTLVNVSASQTSRNVIITSNNSTASNSVNTTVAITSQKLNNTNVSNVTNETFQSKNGTFNSSLNVSRTTLPVTVSSIPIDFSLLNNGTNGSNSATVRKSSHSSKKHQSSSSSGNQTIVIKSSSGSTKHHSSSHAKTKVRVPRQNNIDDTNGFGLPKDMFANTPLANDANFPQLGPLQVNVAGPNERISTRITRAIKSKSKNLIVQSKKKQTKIHSERRLWN